MENPFSFYAISVYEILNRNALLSDSGEKPVSLFLSLSRYSGLYLFHPPLRYSSFSLTASTLLSFYSQTLHLSRFLLGLKETSRLRGRMEFSLQSNRWMSLWYLADNPLFLWLQQPLPTDIGAVTSRMLRTGTSPVSRRHPQTQKCGFPRLISWLPTRHTLLD